MSAAAPGASPPERTLLDVVVDASLAATFVGWALVGLGRGAAASPVGIALVALNLVVGVLFLRRRPVSRHATPVQMLACLPSVVTGPLAMGVAPPIERWGLPATVVFLVACACLVVAMLCLGGSFAILPGLREVVRRGPYRLVRHPIYACEMVMVLAAALAAASWWGAAVFVVAIVTVALRIGVEESVLQHHESYRAYRDEVRFRLVPGLW